MGTLFESNSSQETLYPSISVVGDAADAFDTIKAGRTVYYQAEVAARNILRLIHRDKKGGIMTKSVYEVNGLVGSEDDGVEDLNAAIMWAACGMRDITVAHDIGEAYQQVGRYLLPRYSSYYAWF
ncbi:hypothetical protein BDR05DRAFT_1048352 [Suillus weaverae]|nr:hypothetical protein BDR05DRAFT_1048352 [Suillus weaverae]